MRLAVFFSLAALASPAWATVPVPGPDTGIGLGAMALMGIGYAVLRKMRHNR